MKRLEKNLWRNLIYSLVLFGKLKTTKRRAKEVSQAVDRLINKIKSGKLSSRREVLASLPNKEVVEKVEKEIIPKLAGSSSGYTRTLRLGARRGDGAAMVLIEWVRQEEAKKTKRKSDKTNKGF